MTGTLVLPAPAKINLFLHVTGRRPDGYHELQTAFQFLDYADEISLRPREDGRIRRVRALSGVPPEDDLTLRAARRLRSESGARLGADIEVRKRIPTGAGLGGGSSDGAAALVGLNRLWNLGLSAQRLAELGLDLGADVPIFIHGRAAWAEGVGERLISVHLDEPWYLVVYPGCHVSTRDVFSAPELTRNTPLMTITRFVRDGSADQHPRLSPYDLFERAGNDCEAVVRKRFPQVSAALEWLSGAGPARMTGTGASVFVPFNAENGARRWLSKLPRGWTGFVARGLNRSPLAAWVAD